MIDIALPARRGLTRLYGSLARRLSDGPQLVARPTCKCPAPLFGGAGLGGRIAVLLPVRANLSSLALSVSGRPRAATKDAGTRWRSGPLQLRYVAWPSCPHTCGRRPSLPCNQDRSAGPAPRLSGVLRPGIPARPRQLRRHGRLMLHVSVCFFGLLDEKEGPRWPSLAAAGWLSDVRRAT